MGPGPGGGGVSVTLPSRRMGGEGGAAGAARLAPAAVFAAAGARKAVFMDSIYSRTPEVPDAHARIFSQLLGVPLDPVDFLRAVGLCELAGAAAVVSGVFSDTAYVLLAVVAALACFSHYQQKDIRAAAFCAGLGASCLAAVLLGGRSVPEL